MIIVEIRMVILQGASLRMGSFHIKVIGRGIEGRDFNNYYRNNICDCVLIIRSTPGLTRYLRHGESMHPSFVNAYQSSPYNPHVAQKAVDGAEEGHQSN